MWIYLILGVLILGIVYVFVTKLKLKEESRKYTLIKKEIDEKLSERWSEASLWIDFAKRDKELYGEPLTNLIKLKNTIYDNMSIDEKIMTDENISDNIMKILDIANEDIPLMKKFNLLENEISDFKDEYFRIQNEYEHMIKSFPYKYYKSKK